MYKGCVLLRACPFFASFMDFLMSYPNDEVHMIEEKIEGLKDDRSMDLRDSHCGLDRFGQL